MKNEIRVIGIDDSPFDKFKDSQVLVVGTVFRGGTWMDGLLSTRVTVDGDDSTSKISSMITGSKFLPQAQAILLDGIAVGGFNVVDIKTLSEATGLPVIVVMRDYPDVVRIKKTLTALGMKKNIPLLKKAGAIEKAREVFIQRAGITRKDAAEILKITCTRSNIPEPLRIAHIIGSGIVLGESRGKA